MNGLSLLVALATVGVDVGWESTSSGKLAYTIRIESVLIDKLGEGSAIESVVDKSDRGLQKFRVAVGPKNLQTERVAAATANESIMVGVRMKQADSTTTSRSAENDWKRSREEFHSSAKFIPTFLKSTRSTCSSATLSYLANCRRECEAQCLHAISARLVILAAASPRFPVLRRAAARNAMVIPPMTRRTMRR